MSSESVPLLTNVSSLSHIQRKAKERSAVGVVLTFIFIASLVVSFTVWNESLSRDPYKAALSILSQAPIIDGHIDLPWATRMYYRNNISAFDLRGPMPGHVDIPRLRKGHVGGFFWSVYADCKDSGPDFLEPTHRARDTLEQIDVARLMIDKYSDVFQFTTDVAGIRDAISDGKIASLLGVEGAHQLANSLGALRMYYTLGVRYMTLTHACHNAFADSGGIIDEIPPVHDGLSEFGRKLVSEMNRLGMLVDLSHVSDATALQAIAHSQAPVMWSHSGARAVWDVSRNVPDRILKKIGTTAGKIDAVVMVNFVPDFVAASGNATVHAVADHVEHIGTVAGRAHVGIGSDFDGMSGSPVGLEDAGQYPRLFGELRARGWTKADLVGLAGGNLIRVFEGVERVASELKGKGAQPAMDIYEKREDL